MIGQEIAGRYQVESKLGAGGMGTVYKGLDTQTEQIVAIKHLKPELTDAALIERFKREGEALRDLNHPNIVKMLDTVAENGNHYLIIEYLAGGDLSNLLKDGKLPTEKVLQIAIDICDALTRAHRLNIIHRDLKPANVLIAKDGTPRLTDFGIAHIGKKERVTDTDAIVGTVDYLAPEVLEGELADPRADIWAFGVMMFEMLTGERPFMGDSVAQILMAIMTQPTPDLEQLNPDAPIALVDLVYRMLEKDRHARISSVRHVGAALEDILQGRTTDTPPETRFSPETPDFLQRPKHNLPAQTTPFVGRESELAELAKLLDDPKIRLMTVLAPGGMGKSRLALEVAEHQLPNFENGVYFVELAPLSDPANIVTAIAEATSYQFQGDEREPKQQILDFLRNKNMLLVLDNFEHLLEGAALVTDILQAASEVNILATSRQRLSQSGESLFHLSGMDFPAWETPADAMNYAAVKLFMNSAVRAQPSFELTTDNLDYIARICRLVQGMPLGIVLAAAWLAMLSPQEIADEIAQGIDFLADEGGEVPERQQSIRAVFDYSWQQMTEAEQQVFMRLSVFRGSFTRQAAQAVADANLRVLLSLTNKSLIRRDVDSGRYEIHELLRQYAQEQLKAGREVSSIHDAHMTYYANALHERENHLTGHRQLEALNAIESDFENIRAAWLWAAKQQNYDVIDRMVTPTAWFSYFRNRWQEVAELLIPISEQLSAQHGDTHRMIRGRLLTWQGWIFQWLSRLEQAEILLRQGLTIAHDGDNQIQIAHALLGLSFVVGYQGRHSEAKQLADEALVLYRTANSKWYMGGAFVGLGNFAAQLGQVEEARQNLLEGLALQRETGDKYGMNFTLKALGFIAELKGQWQEADGYYQEALILAREVGSLWRTVQLLVDKTDLALNRGNFEETRQIAEESIQLAREVNVPVLIAQALCNLSILADVGGDYAEAHQLGQEALVQFEKRGSFVLTAKRTLSWVLCSSIHYDDATIYLRDYLEYTSKSGTVLDMIFCVVTSARILTLKGEKQYAIKLLALAFNHPVSLPGYTKKHPHITKMCEDLEKDLGAETYNAAWERGKSLDLETVVQQLLDEFETEL